MPKLITAVVLGLAAALAAALLGLSPFFQTIELKSYDLRVRLTADPAQARSDIVVVEIDELSLRRLEPLFGRWPWPRLAHADLIDYLARAPARVIGYDVLLTEADARSGFDVGAEKYTGAESDRALADSTRAAGMVVHLADATFQGLTTGGPVADAAGAIPSDAPVYHLQAPLEDRAEVRPPYQALARASRWLGHNYLVLDPDGPVRRTVPFVRAGGRDVPSLGWMVAMVAEGIAPGDVALEGDTLLVGARRVPLVTEQLRDAATGASVPVRRALVDYQGPPFFDGGRQTTYRTYSFYDLFYSQQQLLAGQAPLIDPAVFKGAIVLVGVTAAGLHDVFTTPFAEGKMAGPHIHAHVADNLLSGRFIGPAPRWASRAMLVACALLIAMAGVYFTPWMSTAATLIATGMLGWGAVAAFAAGLWLPVVPPMTAMAIAAFSGVGYQYFVEGREKRRVKKLFSRYVSPDVYAEIMRNPALASLGGQRREMTVLFSDIRGFTSASEAGEPEDVVAQLNEYFTRMVDVVFRHRGTVDKFVGDMVMALFGAPLADPDHADHAVAAAREMVAELRRLNAEWAARGKAPLDIGIGINSGVMIAGTIGSETIMSYTVIGDAVNLGARLESLNKEYGTRIIISDATRAQLRTPPRLRSLGEVVVKGKTRPVAIYEVQVDAPPLAAAGRSAEGAAETSASTGAGSTSPRAIETVK